MQTRYFALFIGIIYLLVGVAGFFSALATDPDGGRDLAVDASYHHLFGLFPVNVLHNIVHLLIGVAGVVAYRSFSDARLFSRALAVIYAVLAVFGLIPGLNTLFGLVPLYSHDIWLHAVTALAAAYFGWFAPAPQRGERHSSIAAR